MNLPALTKKTKIGIIYAPFQVADLPLTHSRLIEEALDNHSVVVVALPVRRVTPSKNSPLDFQTRLRMILKRYPQVLVVAVPDEKYLKRRVAVFEKAVSSAFSEIHGGVHVYAEYYLGLVYQENGGKWSCETYPTLGIAEETHRNDVKVSYLPNCKLSVHDKEHAFRLGIIYAIGNQFPISWATVDIAILRIILGATCVLLGKKPGENGWRFPGGFKDRGDMNFETAVWREAGEEVLKPGTNVETSLTYPKYIGSRNINDWRYRDEIDGVTTMFYETSFIGNPEDVLAGDDLGETAWFDLSLVTPDMMEGEHVHLLKMLLESV